MSTMAIIIFPYSGYEARPEMKDLFWETIECCLEIIPDFPPLIVLNMDTVNRGLAETLLRDSIREDNSNREFINYNDRQNNVRQINICRVWSVDTCQMWLTGWGYVIDNFREISRIVQLPGDIKSIERRKEFFDNLGEFIALQGPWDIIIGDFSSGDRFNAKDLIDEYGTYALLANWFPNIAREILGGLRLNKPRSEFINININTLSELLKFRKFAYEQTLNMLIHSYDIEKTKWKYKILRHQLKHLKDEGSFRQYRECLDQVERTERMLKLLWRELNEPKDSTDITEYQRFIDHYERLDQGSTAIRENARIIIRNLLDLNST